MPRGWSLASSGAGVDFGSNLGHKSPHDPLEPDDAGPPRCRVPFHPGDHIRRHRSPHRGRLRVCRRQPRRTRTGPCRGPRRAAIRHGMADRTNARTRSCRARCRVPPRPRRRGVQGVAERGVAGFGAGRGVPRRDPALRERYRDPRSVEGSDAEFGRADDRGHRLAECCRGSHQSAPVSGDRRQVLDQATPGGPEPQRIDRDRAGIVHGPLDPPHRRLSQRRHSRTTRRRSDVDRRLRQPLVGRDLGRHGMAIHGGRRADW